MLFENEGGSYALRQGAVNPPCFLYDINIRDFNNQVQRLSNLRLLDKWWRDKHNIAFRSPEHNKAIGGASESQHVLGTAADIVVDGLTPKQVHAEIEKLIAEGKMREGGLGLYATWVHYDVRGTKARWTK